MSEVWLVLLPVGGFMGLAPIFVAGIRNCEKLWRIALVALLSTLLLGLAPWVGIFSAAWAVVPAAGWIMTLIVALVWAVVDESKRTTPKDYVPLSRPIRTCPDCRRAIPQGAASCGHCGYQLGGRMKGCPYCGENILHSAIVCRYCKSDIPNEAETSAG